MRNTSRKKLVELLSYRREDDAWDYKVELNLTTKKDKHNFVKDMLSFSNFGGGHILIGVDNGGNVVGVSQEIDASRIGNIIESNIGFTIKYEISYHQIQDNSLVKKIGLLYIFPSRKIYSSTFDLNDDKGNAIIRAHDVYTRRNTESTRATQEQIKLINKRLGLKRILRYGTIIVVSLFVAFKVILFFHPFQMQINIEKNPHLQIHREYPKVSNNSTIIFYLPNKLEKVITTDGLNLSDVSYTLLGKSFKIELSDPYWKFSEDSITMVNGTKTLFIIPNDALSEISGRVLSRDGKLLIDSAQVIADNTKVLTDIYGKFKISIPMHSRRKKYYVRIERKGFETVEDEYLAGSEKEFRMEKIDY